MQNCIDHTTSSGVAFTGKQNNSQLIADKVVG